MSSEFSKKTARGWSLCLAVAVIIFLFPQGALAQGLNLSLHNPADNGFGNNFVTQTQGLSIVFESLPLLKSPAKISRKVYCSEDHSWVYINHKIGELQFSGPMTFSLDQYLKYSNEALLEKTWRQRNDKSLARAQDAKAGGGSLLQYEIPFKFPKLISSIIGEGGPSLQVNGYRRISFSGRSQWVDGLKSTATNRQSKFPSLTMEQKSHFTINGKVGSKISVKVDEDSQRQTDLENRIIIRYAGQEDEIIQSVDLGNTNLSISGGFVNYSQNIQGLFGIKTKAKVGGMDLTLITSQQKGANKRDTFKAGAKKQPKFIRDFEYWPNTFFFLGKPIPVDSATSQPRTDVNKNNSRYIRVEGFNGGDYIADIEVYVGNQYFRDSLTLPYCLAVLNPDSVPQDTASELELYRFRKLEPERFYVERKQFWIKLNQRINQEDVLAVYMKVITANKDTVFIGKLNYDTTICDIRCDSSSEINVLKLIKTRTPNPKYVTWDYEWKNVYFLETTNIDREGFKLDIYKGKPEAENIQVDSSSQKGVPYIRILGLDQFNQSGQDTSDNLVDLSRIDLGQGFLYFPQLQPFAADTSYTGNMQDTLERKLDIIYSSNILTDKNLASEYYIYFEGATRETTYYLGHSPILEGSEVVNLNGRPLARGTDYHIVYEIGQITFLNKEVLDPNAEVTIDYEYAPILMPDKKTLFGIQGGQVFSSHFKMNFNALYSTEKSSDARPRVGRESNRNFVWDTNFSLDLNPSFMTKLADAIPLVQASSPSRFQLSAEVAQSLPNPNIRNTVYIDDFEAVQDYTDLGIRRGTWTLCSPPNGKSLAQRGRLIWYNPWGQVTVQEIWPKRQTLNTENKVNILTLKFKPDSSLVIPDSSWNGIIRPMSIGTYDQTKTKYLEIWVHGNQGILNIDLGQIPEDVDGDGNPDTEDKVRNGIRDYLLDDDEDTGLDGVSDSGEVGYDPSNNPDPNGDDWDYSDRENYSRINGTENNRNDPDRGRRPDTEDINGNNTLDKANSYFEFTIDLSDTVLFKVPGTQNSNGWRLYRIPLKDSTLAQNSPNYTEVGTPDWARIEYARVWLTGATSPTDYFTVRIASIQLVGNRWQNLPIAVKDTNDFVHFEEKFDIAVKNTQENTDYSPPPGIAGNLDRNTNVREKEQSLALIYEKLRPGHSGSSYRNFIGAEDYTLYNKMRMFVHGPNSTNRVSFFLQIGLDSLSYYEYRTPVYPGWDDRNEVVMDFEKMTGLKNYLLERLAQDPTAAKETTDANYKIKGNPSLSKIKWFVIGVTNEDSVPVSGEIWIDELTSTDVRRTPGWAKTVNITAGFSDFVTINGAFRKVDSEFHNLGARAGSGYNETRSSFQISNFTLSRFLPPSWGLSLPISYSWQKSENLPRLKVGSDIVLPKEVRAEERTEQTSQSFSFSPSFSKNSNNWLLNMTAKRISFGYSYSQAQGRNPATPVWRTKSYGMNLGYDLSPRKEHSWKLLKWLSFLPDKINNTKFSLLPKDLKFGGNLRTNRSYNLANSNVVTDIFNRYFDGNINASLIPLNSMSFIYSFATARDLRDDKNIIFSLNRKKAKLGIELNRKQTFTGTLSPKWFGFLDQSFSYNASYDENSDPKQNKNGTRVVNNGSRMGINGTFQWKKLISGLLPKGKPKTPDNKPPTKIPETNKIETNPKPKESPGAVEKFFGFIIGLPGKVNPISFSWSKDRSFHKTGLVERPSLAYQFGFSDDPGANVIADPLLANNDGGTYGSSYSLRSGAQIAKGMDMGFGYSYHYGEARSTTEPTYSKSKSFPDLTFSWSGLDKFKYIKKWINSASFQLGYAHKVDEGGNLRTKELNSRAVGSSFSPLVGLSLKWRNGVATNLRVDKATSTGSDLREAGGNKAVTKNDNQGITISSSYSFKAPQGIKFFFLKKIKFESNLAVGVDISQRVVKTRTSVQGKEFNVIKHTTEFSVAPRASYNFSSQINGGLQARWADQNNKKDGTKQHSRELSFWIELKF